MVDVKKIALFVGGVVFGSAGFKVLASKDAKKVYTQTTAAVLRMKDSTMETVNKVQEQAGDILADAKAINEARAAEAAQEVIEDAAETEDAAPEKASEDFWEKDESQLKLDPPPADPNAAFQGVNFSE